MKKRRLVFSDAAIADILEQSDWYADQSGGRLAQRWQKAVTAAVTFVVRRPSAGVPCTFRSAALLGVRRTTIPGFSKHLLFYKFDHEEVLVLRIVHGARDLERLLS